MVRPQQQSNRERDMSEERPKRNIKYKIIKEEREPNKKIFFVIPELLEIATYAAITQKILGLHNICICIPINKIKNIKSNILNTISILFQFVNWDNISIPI